ncbi:MAG: 8-hydroxy-5-deazaflavin:NADPH oxidoreductase [Pseudonocardiales bacterium]|jgi:predicted dinucleotide-binding enzyme|nr:8-hydroxy-5-deazaflavin:NADPH oxidoreductase [Pseudonocardiales bacterium]
MSVIAVLGAGTVGQTLATGWARAGHDVVLGSRTPDADRLEAAVATTGARRAATHADAARAADLIVVTVPGDQVDGLVSELGTVLRDRPVIDTTNVLTPHAPVLHHLDALVGAGAVAFRALHSTGWEQMAHPTFGAERSDMPYAGPDGAARDIVDSAISDLGFRPIWLGEGPAAVAIADALARVWIHMVFTRGWPRRLGLRLLTDNETQPSTRTLEEP